MTRWLQENLLRVVDRFDARRSLHTAHDWTNLPDQ